LQDARNAVYWGKMVHPFFQNRPFYVAATAQGLCLITWPHETFDMLQSWVARYIPHAALIEDQERVGEYAGQLREYLDGKRKSFTLPLDMRGTAFQKTVWQALTRIPYGQTRSYSAIAEAVGKPSAVRATGVAIGANPIPIVVPCHRVIGKNRTLTGFDGGLRTKEELLRLEGYDDYTAVGHAKFQF